jgi:hypothetical protein
VSKIPDSNAALVKRLAEARIDTIEKFLTLEANQVTQILETPRRKADSLLESARRDLINQD